MPKTVTTPWDPAENLKTEEDMVAYLEAALEEADPALVAAALGDIARAKGMTQVARDAGLGRESLYKALSPSGNPEFATILAFDVDVEKEAREHAVEMGVRIFTADIIFTYLCF